MPTIATAQDRDRESRWGVAVSLTPLWKAERELAETFISEGEGSVEGKQFSIGVARGSLLGGDWGVSYVRTPFKKDFQLMEAEAGCENNSCFSFSNTQNFRNVELSGVEVHGFFPIVTIKRMVQVGVNVAGGIASVKGEIEEIRESSFSFTQPNGQVNTQESLEVEVLPANEVIYKYQPLMKVELQGAFIIAPRVKIKVSWGLNYIGTGARLGAVVLF
jgi:hypothetical protein